MALKRALGRLDAGAEDVFVDYGSGLGRAVLVASTLPFRRVTGVELSPEMTERTHARRTGPGTASERAMSSSPSRTPRGGRCRPTSRSRTPTVPSPTRLRPRGREPHEVRRPHPRPLRIVYNYPVEQSRLLATERVRVLDVASARWPPDSRPGPNVIVTYLVLPADPKLREEYAARFPQRVRGAEQWLGAYEPGYVLRKPERVGGMVRERPAEANSASSAG